MLRSYKPKVIRGPELEYLRRRVEVVESDGGREVELERCKLERSMEMVVRMTHTTVPNTCKQPILRESQHLFLLFTNICNTCRPAEVVVLDHG